MLEEMKSWSSIALNLIALAGVIKLWINQGEKSLEKDVTSITERITKAEAKLIEYDRRIQNLEGELGHMPKATALHELELNMEKLNAQIAVLTESLKPIRANAELINDLLREQVKK